MIKCKSHILFKGYLDFIIFLKKLINKKYMLKSIFHNTPHIYHIFFKKHNFKNNYTLIIQLLNLTNIFYIYRVLY